MGKCLVFFSVAVRKHSDKKRLGKEMVCLTYSLLSLKDVKARPQGRNWRQELKQDHGGLFAELVSIACSAITQGHQPRSGTFRLG